MAQETKDEYVDGWLWKIPKWLKEQTDDILEKYRELERRCEPTTKGQSENLFTRAIVIVTYENIPWEHLLTDIVGRWIDNTSESKKVRKEVEEIYFRLLANVEQVEYDVCRNVLLKAVKEYNQRHGYLGKHKRM
jgi:hypothetical protein